MKKVQWICTIFLTQVQIMLYPDEDMLHYTSTRGAPHTQDRRTSFNT